MQTLQTANDLKKYKRQQAFIMVKDSQRYAFGKGTLVTARTTEGSPSVQVKELSVKGVQTSRAEFYEDADFLAPFTIGMSVKPQEGWKVIKQ